jgi:ATP-dependent RNA helicase DeaD
MERNVARLDTVRYVIMDEADEMLNMGFTDSINTILAGVPEGRQTLLFSATMSKEIARIAKKYLHNAHEIVIGTKNEGTANVQHTYYLVHAKDKYPALKRIADYYPEIYGIIFCRTRAETQEIADKLIRDGYSAEALHGDLSQQQRDLTMQKFRTRATQLLVATDVAARGIDVENLTHIVNYGLPDDIESYTHRSGRTGRAGRTGISIAIANLREKGKIRRIEQIINKRFTESALPTGKQICEKQLLRVIDELEKVKVNEEEIATYLPTIYRKLDWLDKEDLIKRMVSSTFNRFLDYYAQAEDLERPIGTNASQGQDRFERGKGRRNERQSRGFGDSGQTRERGWRRVAADNLPDGRRQTARVANTRRAAEPGFTRVFINVGKRDGFRPQHLIEMINHHCRKRIEIGRIDLNRDFSFFEVDERQAKKVITALAKDEFNGRPLQLDVAE